MAYRQNTVSFMRQHRDDFEPYMEDGENFDRYCSRMAQVWRTCRHHSPIRGCRRLHALHAGSPTSAFLLASHWHVKLLTALQDGTWAGQQEQVALARQYGVMIRVYQANQPAWTIKPDFTDFPKVLKCLLYP